jgi:hypothetical protein
MNIPLGKAERRAVGRDRATATPPWGKGLFRFENGIAHRKHRGSQTERQASSTSSRVATRPALLPLLARN